MDFHFSYDYRELMNELKADLMEGLITIDSNLKIVRGEKIKFGKDAYSPIIDYYYNEFKPDEPYINMSVSDVLNEMEYMDKLIK